MRWAARSANESGASRSTKPCSTRAGHTASTRTCGASVRASSGTVVPIA
ncbi:MAG: hypothetical protein O9972_16745 [Burkholderiales bacterium]|nr:hypothetical protein [Burkholderiales bacterium]